LRSGMTNDKSIYRNGSFNTYQEYIMYKNIMVLILYNILRNYFCFLYGREIFVYSYN